MAKGKAGDVIKSIPSTEDVCVRYEKDGKLLFIMTQKPFILLYTLYKVCEDGYERIGKGESPLELEKKFKVNELLLK